MLTTLYQPPAGLVVPFAGATIPSGWLDCDGAAVSRTTYKKLFDALGTTWGGGDGSTTFNLPDLRGRCILGVGTGSGLTAAHLQTVELAMASSNQIDLRASYPAVQLFQTKFVNVVEMTAEHEVVLPLDAAYTNVLTFTMEG